MVEKTIVEILNPMALSGNTTYDELAQTQSVYSCGIYYNNHSNFSTTNPEYTSLIFLSYYPEFTTLISGDNPPYLSLFNVYEKMANNILDCSRFGNTVWNFLMSSYIAHYMAMTFQRLSLINSTTIQDNIQSQIASIGGLEVGLRTRESLGGEEVQIENMINVGLFKDAGQFLTTPYGRIFWDTYISYAKNFFRGVY